MCVPLFLLVDKTRGKTPMSLFWKPLAPQSKKQTKLNLTKNNSGKIQVNFSKHIVSFDNDVRLDSCDIKSCKLKGLMNKIAQKTNKQAKTCKCRLYFHTCLMCVTKQGALFSQDKFIFSLSVSVRLKHLDKKQQDCTNMWIIG